MLSQMSVDIVTPSTVRIPSPFTATRVVRPSAAAGGAENSQTPKRAKSVKPTNRFIPQSVASGDAPRQATRPCTSPRRRLCRTGHRRWGEGGEACEASNHWHCWCNPRLVRWEPLLAALRGLCHRFQTTPCAAILAGMQPTDPPREVGPAVVFDTLDGLVLFAVSTPAGPSPLLLQIHGGALAVPVFSTLETAARFSVEFAGLMDPGQTPKKIDDTAEFLDSIPREISIIVDARRTERGTVRYHEIKDREKLLTRVPLSPSSDRSGSNAN